MNSKQKSIPDLYLRLLFTDANNFLQLRGGKRGICLLQKIQVCLWSRRAFQISTWHFWKTGHENTQDKFIPYFHRLLSQSSHYFISTYIIFSDRVLCRKDEPKPLDIFVTNSMVLGSEICHQTSCMGYHHCCFVHFVMSISSSIKWVINEK